MDIGFTFDSDTCGAAWDNAERFGYEKPPTVAILGW